MTSPLRFALAGNPNCGKTTLFNAITGANQRVGNYPGITVDRKEGAYRYDGIEIKIIDLPGTYSLSPYSMEEIVAREVIVEERPHLVIDVIDATALERSLYLAVQFMELGVPIVLALNMMDEVRKKGIRINPAKLSQLLNIPVVETVARLGHGKDRLIKEAVEFASKKGETWKPLEISYGPDLDPVIKEMTEKIEAADFMTDRYPGRWTAIKYLEKDERIIAEGQQANSIGQELELMVDKVEERVEKNFHTYPEAIIADYRYGYINSLLKEGVLVIEDVQRFDTSDRIDKVLTHKLLGPLIMLGVLYAMFKITFFIGSYPQECLEAFFAWLGNLGTSLIPPGLVQSLVVSGVINGVGGVLSFIPLIVIMFMMIAFLEDVGYMARMAYMLDRVFRIFGLHGCSVMPFIVSGGIAGGCAVPGVMAARTIRSPKERLATLVTAPFMVCGAKIPIFILLVGAFFQQKEAQVMFTITLLGWGMALIVSRILRWTVIKGEPTPFVMELPAYRLPTIRAIAMHTWDRAWQYIKKAGTVILGISIILWAAMTFPQLPASRVEQFAQQRQSIKKQMEIYAAQNNLTSAEKAKMLNEKLASIKARQAQEALRYSLAGRIGIGIEPVTRLCGFTWQTNIALLGGFAAKEVIVSTLGTAYSLGKVNPDIDSAVGHSPSTKDVVSAESHSSLANRIAADPHWTLPAVLSFIVFVLLYAPCCVTVVAMARESSWKWALFAVVFNTCLAYLMAVVVYHLGSIS